MSARPLLLCALAAFLVCSCSTPRPRAPARAPQALDFESAIRRLERKDPASPAVLSAKLAYAQFLLDDTSAPCAKRLTLAQEQMGSVAANPETHILFPAGWALVASLEYRQQLERAACDQAADPRDALLAAAAAAHRAVALYRGEFAYRSMVIMQFDAAIAWRRAGEKAAALAALKSALAMDREFGFEDDARQNYALLLTWRDEPATAIARLLKDFPRRRVRLTFGWHALHARVTVEDRRATLDGGQIAYSHAAAAFERRITAAPHGGWSVTYTHRLRAYDPGVWPSEPGAKTRRLVFPPAPLAPADFKVSAQGEFAGVEDLQKFSTRLTRKTGQLIRAATPAGKAARIAAEDALEGTAIDFSPGMLEADTAQSYELETAMWIGATLDQGDWYEVSAPLALPGMGQFVIEQHIEFAFTRRVPCTAAATADRCVEIVLHMRPDAKALRHMLADIGGPSPGGLFTDYFASMEERIVIDPTTLLPYRGERRIYWYAAIGQRARNAVVESEHVVSGTRYAH